MRPQVATPVPEAIRPAPTRRALAWALWSVAAFVFVTTIGFAFARGLQSPLSAITEGAAFFAYGLVGLIIALRQPRIPIGWIFLGVWVGVAGIFGLAGTYAQWAALEHPGAPGAVFATWLGNWAWVPIFTVLLTYPMLLFPDGKLPGPRWRPVA
jgi:hypothetical protein